MASVANSGNVTAKAKKDQLGALGLVVNAIVLWNTLYMAAALKELSRARLRQSVRKTWRGCRP